MDRQATESLARFCIEQRNEFDPDEWFRRSETDGKIVALAAKYLSMTSWYGHDEELVEVAAKIYPDLENGAGLYGEAQAMSFDWPHLSTTVRVGIALRQVQQAAAPVVQRAAPATRQSELFDERAAELR